MSTTKTANLIFKAFCAIECLFLLIGGLGLAEQHHYAKCAVGLAGTAIIIFIAFKRESWITWLSAIGVLLLVMYLVGIMK